MKLIKKLDQVRKGRTTKRERDKLAWEVSMHTDAMLDRKLVEVEKQAALIQQELSALWQERAYRVEYTGLKSSEYTEYPEMPR